MEPIRRWIVFVAALWLVGVNACPAEKIVTESRQSQNGSAGHALESAAASITDVELKKHIQFLASDTLQGREAGSHGGYAAGSYIVEQLRQSEVPPVSQNGDYFQYFAPNYRNILAVIPGSDPKLKNEYVLVGGHYDHVGFGNRSNSRGPIGVVHNGADDNASGTAGILELAEALTEMEPRPARSILIAFWDAEEKGLLGSKHYVDFPVVPLRQIRLHLNADMIGRLRPQGFEISGWRAAAGLRRFLSRQNTGGLKLRFLYSYKPESDHWPFFEHGVPSLMLHTGKHDDYHRPSDDTHLVNLAGVRQTSQFMLQCAAGAANAKSLPVFREESFEEDESVAERLFSDNQSEPKKRLRLGISYDGELARERIIRVIEVEPGSPADRAGFQPGDRVLKFGARVVEEVRDFRALVRNAPNSASVRVQRGESRLTLKVSLRRTSRSPGIAWQTDDAEPGSLIVTHVAPGSAASEAGFEPRQRIVSINRDTGNGDTALSGDQLRQLFSRPRSAPVRIEVEQHGRFRTLTLAPTAPASEETSTGTSEAATSGPPGR